MRKMLFISRHTPTDAQILLAHEKGYELEHIGDRDAFTVTPSEVWKPEIDEWTPAVAVVHPAAALRLCPFFTVGVFENSNRAPEGEKPQFEATHLHIYQLIPGDGGYSYPRMEVS